MILKGKAKEDFKRWLYQERICRDKLYENILELEFFETLPFSMQYGVLVDFFDSVGLSITTGVYFCEYEDKYLGVHSMIYNTMDLSMFESWSLEIEKTRTEARQKAIEKAVEIYNNTK